LVCGSAGVGKTPLIFRVLKVDGERSKNEHGHHDIELSVPSQGGRCMICESRSFQGATLDETKILRGFLQRSATNPWLMERLHIVWYVSWLVIILID
jgi:hypothetical protein